MESKFCQSAANRLKGFDPAALIALIQAIIAAISNCKPPAKAAMKVDVRAGRIGPLQRGRVAAMALFTDFHTARGRARDIADAICDEAISNQEHFVKGADGLDFIDSLDAEVLGS